MAEILDERIRSLITELIDSAPQAPSLPELEWAATERVPSVTQFPQPRRRSRLVVGGLAGAVAVILVVALLVPIVAERRGRSTNPIASLANGEWLHRAQRVSLTLRVSSVGKTATPGADARVNATLDYWASAQNQLCVSIDAEPATFATTTNHDAWRALQLHDTPTPNPWTACASGGVGVAPPDQMLTDVSGLSTDPAVLADQLWKGTTGIPALDSDNANLTGYQRAEMLLVGPTTGSNPAFGTTLLHALPLIPGVDALGAMTTHSGDHGVGFADDRGFGQGRSVVVLDSTTGALLEAQNIPFAMFDINTGPLRSYMPESVSAQGGASGVTVEWLDPIGSASVVDDSDLPVGLSVPSVVHYTASVVGIVKPTVTGNAVPNLAGTLASPTCDGGAYYASARSQDTSTATPITTYDGKLADFPAQLSVYCTGPTAEAKSDVQILRASGFFSSVVVTYVPSPPTTTSP